MFKAIISSQNLADAFGQIPKDAWIDCFRLHDNQFMINLYNDTDIMIPCRFEASTAWMPASAVSVDRILRVLKSLPIMPLVVEIAPNSLKITIDF